MLAYRGTYEADSAESTSSNFNGVELSTRTMPAGGARNGGDWCEAFAISRDIVALSIGDVCGHGDECFQTVVALRQVVREGARSGLNPSRALGAAGNFLLCTEPGMHATSTLVYLDTKTRTITFANAGHPPPILGSADAAHFLEFPSKDAPLGVVFSGLPTEYSVEMPSDALLVLYTDGVTERERNPVKGETQLRDAAVFAHHVRSMPGASVIERQMFLQGSNPDDAAILTARMPVVSLVVHSGARPRQLAHQA